MAECNVDVVTGSNKYEHSNNEEAVREPLQQIQEDDYLEDIQCGFSGWTPKWLQIFASKKSYIFAYSTLGLYEASVDSYYTGTISTIEKRFKLPSTASGIIASAWDVGSMSASLFIAYFGSASHKTRWVAAGLVLMATSCFMRYLPHYIYGPGVAATHISYNDTLSDDKLCLQSSNTIEENCSLNSEGSVAFFIFLLAHLTLGIGSSTYYTLGAAYLDDNIKKNKFPFTLGIVASVYYIGPACGFLISSLTLSYFINPGENPPFDEDDPRWTGAWQLGWIPFGYAGLAIAVVLALFPRILPREAERRKNRVEPEVDYTKKTVSFKEFKRTLYRLAKNPVLMLNTISLIFYIFGIAGFWIFLPKYIEAQFRKTPSEANIVTGAISLFCTSIGMATGGTIISKFKPNSKILATWCVLAECLEMATFITFAYLGCFKEDLHGEFNVDGSWNVLAECNTGCNCSSPMEYSPVCSFDSSKTFYSPCHAGCTTSFIRKNMTIFGNCSCIDNDQLAKNGACPSDCGADFITFVILLCVMELLASTGRPANTIIQFRAVHPDDKSTMIAINEVLVCGIGWIPGPIFYGMILDSSCLIWDVTCGQVGNCWLYDGRKMRFLLNFVAAFFVFIAILLDIGVLMNVGKLKIYDEDESKVEEINTQNKALTKKDLSETKLINHNNQIHK